MDHVEAEGDTLDEAIAKALKILGVERDQAAIEVLSAPRKGVLGIGAKKARVRASVRSPLADETEERKDTPDLTYLTFYFTADKRIDFRALVRETTSPAKVEGLKALGAELVTGDVRAADVYNSWLPLRSWPAHSLRQKRRLPQSENFGRSRQDRCRYEKGVLEESRR